MSGTNGNGKGLGGDGHAKKEAFLAALAIDGTISGAAESAGCHRNSHYGWMAEDPDYPERFEQAKANFAERLEREAVRRAVEGTEEPVYQGGMLVGSKQKYSDVLLIFMLKGALPDKYKDRQETEHKGMGGLYDGDPLELGKREHILAAATRKSNGETNGNGHANGNGHGGNGHHS